MRLDTKALDELASLVEELRETGGDLEANLAVVGTVGAPKVSFTRRMMSRYGRPGLTMTMSAPSARSRATSRNASSELAESIW